MAKIKKSINREIPEPAINIQAIRREDIPIPNDDVSGNIPRPEGLLHNLHAVGQYEPISVKHRSILILSCALVFVLLFSCIYFAFSNRTVQMIDYSYKMVDTDLCTFLYSGPTVRKKPSGIGTLVMKWNDGSESKYEGNFSNGYPDGEGHYYYSDGTHFYDADWKWKTDEAAGSQLSFLSEISSGVGMHAQNQIYGLYFGDGIAAFEGEWYENKLNGYGKIHYENPSKVNYDTDISTKHIFTLGEGHYKWQESLIQVDHVQSYSGYLLNGSPSSYGHVFYSDGDSFMGLLDQEIVPFFGQYHWNYGGCFIGIFDTNGHPHYGSYITRENMTAILSGSIPSDGSMIDLEEHNWGYDDVLHEDMELMSDEIYGSVASALWDTYTGMLLNEKRHGYGCQPQYTMSGFCSNSELSNVSSFEGEFSNDEIGKYGKIHWNNDPDHYFYVGSFENGEPSGTGMFYYSDGHYVEGDNWSSNKGFEEIHINGLNIGTVYTGMCLNENMTGNGVAMFCGSGITADSIAQNKGYVPLIALYSGSWANDKPFGYGVFGYDFSLDEANQSSSWANCIIEGEWAWTDGTPHGENGIYVGMLCDGMISGYGICTHSDGSYDIGIWENGTLVQADTQS